MTNMMIEVLEEQAKQTDDMRWKRYFIGLRKDLEAQMESSLIEGMIKRMRAEGKSEEEIAKVVHNTMYGSNTNVSVGNRNLMYIATQKGNQKNESL